MVTEPEPAQESAEGFKLTQLGPLPEAWEAVQLGDVMKQRKEFLRIDESTEYKRCRVQVRGQGVVLRDTVRGESLRTKLQQVCRKGEFLTAEIDAKVGGFGVVPEDFEGAIVSSHYFLFQIDGTRLHSAFLNYFVRLPAFLHQVQARGSTNYASVRPNHVLGYVIPLPPLSEQRAIAHVLSTIQSAIEATDRVIAAAREFKRSLMQYLFTYGPVAVSEAEFVPLKETEIGPMPEHWDVVSLGKVTTASQYGLSLRGSADGAFPILRMNNLANGHVDSSSLQYVNLDGNSFRKFKVHKGDILFNRTNSHDLVGKTALFDSERDFVFASYLIRVVTDGERLCPQYLNDLLNWDPSQVRLKALASRGVSQSNISASKLRNLEVPLPPTSEQCHIADVLSAVVHKIETEEKRKAALKELFRTMLHLLMTGQVRVRSFLPKAEKEVS